MIIQSTRVWICGQFMPCLLYTSLLNLICGSIPLDAGSIRIGGKDITHMPEYRRQRRIGRVYQNPAMGTCPSMTILENMVLADNKGKPFNLLPGTNRQRIDFYREQLKSLGLGLEDKLHVKVGVLSGGQRQAMALDVYKRQGSAPRLSQGL